MQLRKFLFVLLLCNYRAVHGDLCKKCYCKNQLIESVPELQVECSYQNLNETHRDNYNDVFELDYSHNNLKEFGAIRGQNLAALNLAYNQISSISRDSFQGATNLVTLHLNHNNLENIDRDSFMDLARLQVLDLQFNRLKTVQDDTLRPLTNLRSLDLSYNNLPEILTKDKHLLDILGLSSDIQKLRLNGLGVEHVERNYFNGFEQLKVVTITDNQLNEMPIFPRNILHLDLSGNNFTEIIVRSLLYPELKTLKLNRLRNLNNVHHYAFYDLKSLEELSIENCPRLRTFSEVAFMDMDNDVHMALKRFSLAGCGLETLNRTYIHLFSGLESVNLQNNPWKCECSISWMKLLHKDKLEGHDNLM